MIGSGHYLRQGAVEKGGGYTEFECKQLEGGGGAKFQCTASAGGGEQNLSAQTSDCHLRAEQLKKC